MSKKKYDAPPAEKPVVLPMKFEEAVDGLLAVRPDPKEKENVHNDEASGGPASPGARDASASKDD